MLTYFTKRLLDKHLWENENFYEYMFNEQVNYISFMHILNQLLVKKLGKMNFIFMLLYSLLYYMHLTYK